MATTFEAIRNQQCSVIEALTPSRHAQKKFLRHAENADFTDWVASYPAACLRRFQILSNFDLVQGPTTDGSIELCEHTFEIRIAYPMDPGLYGVEGLRDMEDTMTADLHQLDAAIGLNGGANYVANQDICQKVSSDVIQLEKSTLLGITFRVQYDRSV